MKEYNAPYQIENFIKIYERSFIENWELPALTDYPTQETITYGEFARRIAMTHLFFENLGIKQGDRIALCGRNTMRWVEVFMATITYGAVIVPILAEFNPVDITHIVNHSEADLLIVGEHIWEHMEPESLLTVKGVLSLDRRELLYERDIAEIERILKLQKRRFNRK